MSQRLLIIDSIRSMDSHELNLLKLFCFIDRILQHFYYMSSVPLLCAILYALTSMANVVLASKQPLSNQKRGH